MTKTKFATLVVVAAAVGCRASAPPPPPAPSVTVAAAQRRSVADWDEFSGRFEPVEAVDIRPRISGYIDRIAFHEGAEVKVGDVLFVIDQRPYAAALAGAEADLAKARTAAELARSMADRIRPLVASHAIAQEEMDSRESTRAQALAAVKSYEAAVETARLNMAWTEIRSPINGRVSRAEVTAGNLVLAGPPTATLLTTVVSLDPIYVYFDGDEQSYLKHDALSGVRDQVFVGLTNEDGYPHQGRVDFVDNRVETATGTIRVRAVLDNRDRQFTPGLFARVKLVGGAAANATLIEDRAIGTDQDKKFVYVLQADSTVAYRQIHVGRLIDGLRIVADGVKPGELIVVNGLQRVRPGAKVIAANEPTPSDSAANQRTALASGR